MISVANRKFQRKHVLSNKHKLWNVLENKGFNVNYYLETYFEKHFSVYSCWEVLLIFEIFSLLHWAKWVQFSFNCFEHHVWENMTECKLLLQDVRGRGSCWILWHLSVSWKHEMYYYFFNSRSGRNVCLPCFQGNAWFSSRFSLQCKTRNQTFCGHSAPTVLSSVAIVQTLNQNYTRITASGAI